VLRTRTSASPGVTARAQAVKYLARREYSATELSQRLLGLGYESDEVTGALRTLQEKGMQSDARFAEVFCRSRVAKGYGPARIEYELRDYGIDAEIVADAMSVYDHVWRQELARLLAKRTRGADLRDARERAKQIRFLYGRGFSDAQIRAAMKEYLG